MAEIANTAWYRQGTVSVTDGSTKVTGTDTHFTTAGINPGATFRIDGRPYAYEVASVVSDTEIQLARAYYGGTVSKAAYSIDRNFQSTTNANLAQRVTSLVGIYEDVRDGVYLTIEGKSAYQVAVKNGYTGTEAQWVESLKAANEWQTLNNRTEILTYKGAAAHNALFRGKNLGTAITAEQIAAIRTGHLGLFGDMYIGDYWNVKIDGKNVFLVIMGFNTFYGYWVNLTSPDRHIVVKVMSASDLWKYPVNDTATAAGHMYNSKLYTEYFPVIREAIKGVIGDGEMKKMTDHVADAINSSNTVSHRTRVDEDLWLLSWQNITGETGKVSRMAWETGGNVQFPYYKFTPRLMPLHANAYRIVWDKLHWMAENYGATMWEAIDNTGGTSRQGATNVIADHGYVRPFFLLG